MTVASLYCAIFVLALVPGLPLGFALFGRRHAAGWICGALFGYMLTALVLWVPIRLGVPSVPAFVIAWIGACAVAWLALRGAAAPLVPLPAWTRRETLALAFLLAIALAIAVPPLVKAGTTDAAGDRYYRAYFTADFVWHEALTSELAKFSSPPRNPYLENRPIHYYWAYFIMPASAAGISQSGLAHVETFLKINAVGTAVLFVSAMFLCAWCALPRAWPVAVGVALAMTASSAEGAFALWRLWDRHVPLSDVFNLNIDALSNWWFGGLRVDGLQRCFWWVPQHSMAYALGLVALAMVNASGVEAPVAAIVLAGVALAGSAMMNPFVGGVFALAWGGAALIYAARSDRFGARVLRHALAAVPVVLALAWCLGNQMVEGGGSALEFGWLGDARHAPVASLMLSLGPALVPALVGLAAANARVTALALLAGLSLFLMYFFRLNVDASWVGFRAGQMFLAAVPALIACGIGSRATLRRVAVVTVVLAFAIGIPTVVIDAYNAQDISNFSDSPIGPWTVTVTRDEHEALEWIRRATPATAIVQMDPTARARQTWSLIPSFAQRRMAAGQPISLLGGSDPTSEYGEKTARVREMYATTDATAAHDIARSLRIDYIWIDRVERNAYPSGMAKFAAAPQYFAPAFKNGEVTIYHVE